MKHYVLGAALCALALPVSANEYEPMMREFFETEVSGWASDALLIEAVRVQNERTGGLTADEIDALDQRWRGEVGASDTPTIDQVLGNAASDFLRERVAASGGVISEVFVMDAQGLNVAASDVTSDYWQGDEAKFQETFGVGPEAVHVSDVELDESTQTYQSQISVTLVDPQTKAPVGAVTVGVNPEGLF